VVPRLASCTESVAEHEPQRSFQHCFVGLPPPAPLLSGFSSLV
jgi:hypothetical protein